MRDIERKARIRTPMLLRPTGNTIVTLERSRGLSLVGSWGQNLS